ncbi:phosphoribosylamine--glycine ligase [Pseudothermotoga sp. U03pept]|uniref:phosphoribosylamine--glycine ligase n=1 Tax=Pseudothermotoga sp. U03pept TaxID=3447012 RepID=UPI003F0DD518
MKVLIIGQGGREHALAWKLSGRNEIYCAPGNAGMSEIASYFEIYDKAELLNLAIKEKIDMTIVGPEAYLVEGIVDDFEKHDLKIFGPNQKAATIEGSKVFAKVLMQKYGIPTSPFEVFDDPNAADRYILRIEKPVVIKADGLAAGKGAIVARTKEEAFKAIDDLMRKKIFKDAGNKVVVEEFLTGWEVSILAFCDGYTIVPMVSSMDYKKAYENDRGPNTGGMGSIAPSPYYTGELSQFVNREILLKTVNALNREGIEYKGVLYAGLMVTKDGPKVLEFNCRFGDPETQSILLLLKSDLMEIFEAVVEGELSKCKISWSDEKAVCVVLASEGYPESYKTGYEISGLEKLKDVVVFHAGTKKVDGKILTSGGRVLNVCAKAKTYVEAKDKVYEAIKKIHFENMYFRKDVANLSDL